MKSIREEINAIASGESEEKDNVLKNAPHTIDLVANDEWNKPYSRQKAAFPLDFVTKNKFWPSVSRVDDAYGDRNLVCSCETIENYK